MPQYTFECVSCHLEFTRKLNLENHVTHPCPDCGEEAPRRLEGFGFDFAPGTTPGNSGVTKHDSPTADQVVGRSAEARWGEYSEREKVKDKVREVGGSRALIRRTSKEAIEYEEGGTVVETRRKIVKRMQKFEEG